MSLYHLSAELPEDREERVKVMAEGFKTALHHAATDPEIRLRMLMGEAYQRWRMLLTWFKGELARESPEVREFASKFITGELLLGKEDEVLRAQLALLERVMPAIVDADPDTGS